MGSMMGHTDTLKEYQSIVAPFHQVKRPKMITSIDHGRLQADGLLETQQVPG